MNVKNILSLTLLLKIRTIKKFNKKINDMVNANLSFLLSLFLNL